MSFEKEEGESMVGVAQRQDGWYRRWFTMVSVAREDRNVGGSLGS